MGEFIDRNLEYADLIDKVHPGAGAYPKHEPGEGCHDEELTAIEDDLA
ncbi:hypothetical protein [Streptomyces mirabilis]